MILALVLLQDVGGVGLVAETHPVEGADARLPVAVEQVSGNRGVDLVLPSGEVPHEVAPVHPAELVVEEVAEVRSHRRFAVLHAGNLAPLARGVGLIEVYIAGICRGPHPREEHLALAAVACVRRAFRFDVPAVERGPVGPELEIVGSVEILPVEERNASVLLTAEVADEGVGVIGLVLVGRGLDRGTDDHYREQREADDERCQAEEEGVEEHLVFLQRREKSPEAKREKRQDEECRAAVIGKVETVDEDAVEEGRDLRKVRDEYEHDRSLDHDTDHEYAHKLPEGVFSVLVLAVVVHEHEGRDGQEVQKVDAYGKTHKEGYEHYPAVGMWLVGVVVPLCHRPEDKGGEKGRHRIDFALDGREPESVREAVGKGAHDAAAEDGYGFREGILPVLPGRLEKPFREEDYRQIEEENGQGRADAAHRVDRDGRVVRVGEHCEESRKELEDGVSRGVAHFELIGRRYKLAAVPEGRGRLDGQKVGHR